MSMRRMYYWIWGKAFDKRGNLVRVLNGYFDTEEEAVQEAMNIKGLQSDYEIVQFDTKDIRQANRRLRYRVEQEYGVADALQRFRHKA